MLNKISPKFAFFGAILGVCAAAFTGTARAGEEMSTGKQAKEMVEEEEAKESFITGDIGVNVVSQYISRGYVLENQGLIAQPFFDLYIKLYSGEGFINSVTLNLGVWASLHSEKTDAGDFSGGSTTTEAWYEFDYTPGISIGFAKNFTFTATYLEFNYPNDGFVTQRLVQGKLAYNDADLLGPFALNPYVKVEYFFETPDEGLYYEVGIAPGLPVGPVKLAFPVIAGFGSNEFYGDFAGVADEENFGYVSAGVTAAYAMDFIPEGFGAWTLTAGATYYYLGDALESFNDPNVRDSDDSEFVFSGGLTVAF
jgi:hypothetical protein